MYVWNMAYTALFLKNGTNCTIKYGRQVYDYQEGTIVSFSPGQIIDVDLEEDEISPDVIGLIFHPDLIYGTLLGDKIGDYSFFEYSQREALHLSESERALFLECLGKIERKYNIRSTDIRPTLSLPTYTCCWNTSTASTTVNI